MAVEERPSLAVRLGWNRSSYILMSTFVLVLFVLGYVWWPLALEYLNQIDPRQPIYRQIDWLLIGIFAVMSLLIMSGADLRVDALIIGVGLVGGLVIESWGTQTELWVYYTQERPPLWIIPAWPIASLSIDRLVRFLDRWVAALWRRAAVRGGRHDGPLWTEVEIQRFFARLYWLVFPLFMALMLFFVWPTLDKSFTILALLLCTLLILTPTDYRLAVLTFMAGSGLGYFLERWGTTRLCWTYYTQQTPPIFAVFAHGMAAVAFWRAALVVERFLGRWKVGRWRMEGEG